MHRGLAQAQRTKNRRPKSADALCSQRATSADDSESTCFMMNIDIMHMFGSSKSHGNNRKKTRYFPC